jgi:hypothetical protein
MLGGDPFRANTASMLQTSTEIFKRCMRKHNCRCRDETDLIKRAGGPAFVKESWACFFCLRHVNLKLNILFLLSPYLMERIPTQHLDRRPSFRYAGKVHACGTCPYTQIGMRYVQNYNSRCWVGIRSAQMRHHCSRTPLRLSNAVWGNITVDVATRRI